MAYETIEYERRGPVGIITLNRPHVSNAINGQMLDDLNAVLDHLEGDDDVRVVVLQGAGRGFCSGFDLKDEAEAGRVNVVELAPVLQHDFDSIMRFWNFPKPTISALHGYAIAGGCNLALACDLTIADETLRLGEPELRFGAAVVVMLLPWITGPKQAKELYLTGDDRVSAARCLEMGLVNKVVPKGEHLDAAIQMARKIAVIDTFSVAVTKKSVNRSYDIKGMRAALADAHDLGVHIEAAVLPEREEFMAIARKDGLKAALAWRDARFEDTD
ncbi:MAG TPA: enoyl-CoA hydratase-related protein [Acidobacteriota bacterium]|nr:enoyl-CoA hydratase-related protein [Acidobacteriota bacterium]